jgi:aminoglycoside 2'-N-acetyltransferase I
MRVSVRLANNLSEDERRHLFEWGEDLFGMDEFKIRWRPKELHFVVEVSELPVSHVGVLRHTILVGTRKVTVGGVGGVITRGDAQARGYASLALERATTFMRDELDVEFGFLFCRDPLVPFYKRHGWQLLDVPVTVEQGEEPSLVIPINAMVLPFAGRAWPQGAVTLESLPW